MTVDVKELKKFLIEASNHGYAAGGERVAPQRPGYKELEYRQGDWYERDSYVGHYQAPGMTTVYFKDVPVWTCAYGGKVIEKFYPQVEEIFTFLRKALLRKDLKKAEDVPVRGPSEFNEGDFRYTFSFEGDMACFYGRERIYLKGELVFFQDIIGGFVIGKTL